MRVYAFDAYSISLAMKRTKQPHGMEQLSKMLNSRLGIFGMYVRVQIVVVVMEDVAMVKHFHYMVSTS